MARARLAAGLMAPVAVGLAGMLWAWEARAPAPKQIKWPRDGTVSLQLLGVNDFHGHLEPGTPIRRGGRAGRLGGAAWLAAHLDRAERAYPGRTIRVHAGDMLGASPLVSSHFHDEPTVRAMNLMRFDAGTLGNHEFDEGAAEATRLVRGGRRTDDATRKHTASGPSTNTSDPAFAGVGFPYVAANTVDRRGRAVLPPYTIVERAGVRVGFIGVTTRSTPEFLLDRHASKLRFRDISTTVNRYVGALRRRGVETIVVLAHAGGFDRTGGDAVGEVFDETRAMSDAVDVVVAGHSHSVLDAKVPNRGGRGHKLVVQAGKYGGAYDRVRLKVDRRSGDVVAKSARIAPTWHDEVLPRPDVGAEVTRYANRTAELGRRVLGRVRSDLRRRLADDPTSGELGDLVADAQRSYARADVAFVDPVAVRSDLQSGRVTYSDLFEVAPYEHPLVRVRMRGEALTDLAADQALAGPRPRLHVSGLSEGTRMPRLSTGAPVRPRRIYTVAASELLATGRRAPLLRENGWGPRPFGTELDALVSCSSGAAVSDARRSPWWRRPVRVLIESPRGERSGPDAQTEISATPASANTNLETRRVGSENSRLRIPNVAM